MEDVRLIAKGTITDLSKGFSLGGVPFSVYVRSKENTMLSDTLLDCRLIGDKGGKSIPRTCWRLDARNDSVHFPKRY